MLTEVTKAEFWTFIMALTIKVHPRIVTAGSDFMTQDMAQRLVGRTVGVDGHYWDSTHRYFLAQEQ